MVSIKIYHEFTIDRPFMSFQKKKKDRPFMSKQSQLDSLVGVRD